MDVKMDSQKLLKTFLRDISQKNKVIETLEKYLPDVEALADSKKKDEIPFSSERKFSACVYSDQTLVLGAPEILLEKSSAAFKQVELYTKEAYRVVTFGTVEGELKVDEPNISKKFKVLAVIAMDDPIREEAPATLESLTKENIEYRIISGDSADTVSAIAKKINPKLAVKAISGSDLEVLSPQDFEKKVLETNIFARIKPHQKQAIVKVLKKNKLFTIMIGDGVNDVLALKESDLGIAMNGGSSMAKDVADVVLLNNSFATLPILLYEGRRIITNIQTIANIYLIKNVSAIVSILILGFIGLRFPFDPKHVEVASLLIIGIPSFVFAFEKHNFASSDEGFVKRLLLFSGIVGFINALVFAIIYAYFDLASNRLLYSRSMLLTAVIFLGINNLVLIYLQHYTFGQIMNRKIIVYLIIGVLSLFGLILVMPQTRDFFEIGVVDPLDLLIAFGFSLIGSMINVVILKRAGLIPSVKLDEDNFIKSL